MPPLKPSRKTHGNHERTTCNELKSILLDYTLREGGPAGALVWEHPPKRIQNNVIKPRHLIKSLEILQTDSRFL